VRLDGAGAEHELLGDLAVRAPGGHQLGDLALARRERALGEYGGAFLRALAGIAAISTGNRRPMSVWEVNART